MRVTAPRADASVRPYSATGQYFNRHHLRCHILAVGLRVRGVFPAGRRGTGGSDSATVGVGQRGVGGQRRVCGLCGAGRAGGAVRLLRSAQPAGVSVWAQMQLFAGAAFCPQVLLASRLLHLVFLQGILRFCVRFLPGDVGVCSTLSARIVPLLHLPPDAAAVGFVFLCAALYKAWQNLYNK